MAASWLDLLDGTIEACGGAQRPDLALRLQRKRAGLLDPRVRLLVVGAANQGKSQLVNAMVNAPVCAVGDDVTTSAHTVVQHADAPSAALVTAPGHADRLALPSGTGRPDDRVAVPIDEISRQVGGRPGAHGGQRVLRAEIGIPRALLAGGLVLVDTPAIGRHCLGGVDPGCALEDIEQADAVVFASDATAELSGTELDLLARIASACPNIVLALTKIDMVRRWRQVADRNRALLAAAKVPAMLIPVSAELRLAAAHRGDTTINAESGFPELIGCVQHQLRAKDTELAPRIAGVSCAVAVAELATGLRAQLSTVAEQQQPDIAARLTDAQHALDELRRRTTRSQTLLGDQMADLVADVEHDLRERTRKVLREVDVAFDTADPKTVWDDFAPWLADNLTEAAEVNSAWLIERCQWVADQVLATFPTDGLRTPADDLLDEAEEQLAGVDAADMPRLEPFSTGQRMFTGLRGSYGGVLMFGLITSLAGLPLINPISLGAGAMFAGKSVKDESDGRLKRRQAAAKAAVQHQVDDFFLQCSKESRDLTRRVQRVLRDHITDCAEQLAEQVNLVSAAARQAAQVAATERQRRELELRQHLQRLVALHERARTLAAIRTGVGAGGLELTA